jgi:hypothetical protein
MLSSLLFLPTALLLAQAPATPASDAPRIDIPTGQDIRITAGEQVQVGRFLSFRDGKLRYFLTDGAPHTVPAEALSEVAVRSHPVRTGALIGAPIGALVVGLAAAGLTHFGNDIGDGPPASVGDSAVVGAITGAVLGAAIGAFIGSTNPDWRPVYTRPQ